MTVHYFQIGKYLSDETGFIQTKQLVLCWRNGQIPNLSFSVVYHHPSLFSLPWKCSLEQKAPTCATKVQTESGQKLCVISWQNHPVAVALLVDTCFSKKKKKQYKGKPKIAWSWARPINHWKLNFAYCWSMNKVWTYPKKVLWVWSNCSDHQEHSRENNSSVVQDCCLGALHWHRNTDTFTVFILQTFIWFFFSTVKDTY